MTRGETAIGKPGVAAKASRTITIEMSDKMRFTPSDLTVKRARPCVSSSRTPDSSSTNSASALRRN